LKPLTTKSIIEIWHIQIDAVLPTMGGQTALNLCLKQMKEFGRFRVRIGVMLMRIINMTENRAIQTTT
jgi:carbamoyl-phosphate synthase large subunit